MNYYQTGDILYFQEPVLPKKVKALTHGIILKSPATGHAHVVKNGKLYKANDGVMWISVSKKAVLKHEEHKDLSLPKGIYRTQIVREFDHLLEEARAVVD